MSEATLNILTAGKSGGNPKDFPSMELKSPIYQLMAFSLQGYHSENSPED